MSTHQKGREFVGCFWNARHEPYKDGYFDAYYDGFLSFFAFMHLSGHYRIMPKKVPGIEQPLALVSLGDCTPGLASFDFESDNSKWNFRKNKN